MWGGGLAWPGLLAGRFFLHHQVDDPLAVRTRPGPDLACFRVTDLTVVPEVLGHGRVLLPEAEGQTLIEVVCRGNAVRNDLSFREKNVSADFLEHY